MQSRMFMALVMGLFAACAFAKGYPTFKQLDVNGDGLLSLGELEVIEEFNQEDEEFAESDLDKNGAMDASEYQAWMEMQAARAIAKSSGKSPEAKN